jgi:hypothetical protein
MTRRKKKTTKTIIRHVQKRAKQRLGLDLREDEVRHIAKQIRLGKATFIARQSSNKSIWEVSAFGLIIPVAYDKKRKVVSTILPEDYVWRTWEEEDFFPDYIELEIKQPGPLIEDLETLESI